MQYVKWDIPFWAFLVRKETADGETLWQAAKVTSIRLQPCPDPRTDMLESHQGSVSLRISINLRRQSRASFHVPIRPVFCFYTWRKSALHRSYFLKLMDVVYHLGKTLRGLYFFIWSSLLFWP